MLAKDPALRAAFERRVAEDPAFAQEPVGAARLLLPASSGLGRAPQPLPGLPHGERRALESRVGRTVRMRRIVPVVVVLLLAALAPLASIGPAAAPSITVRLAPGAASEPIDGRLLLLISTEKTGEPRFQIDAGPKTQQVFGIDVDGWRPGETKTIDAEVLGYPRASLRDVPPGEYRVQALLHRYETFTARRRSRGQAADGSRRRAAVEPRAGQPVQHAGVDPHRRERVGRPGDDRSGDPADRGSADDEVHPPRADPERAADEVLGAPDAPRRARPRARGLRRASERALSAGHLSRPLPADDRRLPRDAARPEREVRVLGALPPGLLQPDPGRAGVSALQGLDGAGISRACSWSRSSTPTRTTTTRTR